jgi:NitT/TauT family transport system substrate-binding protein
MKEINDDPAGSAALWVKADKSKLTPAETEKIIRDKDNTWTMTPQKIMDVANYMGRVNMIPVTPANWKDLFVADIHDLPGS